MATDMQRNFIGLQAPPWDTWRKNANNRKSRISTMQQSRICVTLGTLYVQTQRIDASKGARVTLQIQD